MNLINALEKQENQVVIQAHNGIRFDFSFYWNEIIKEHLLSKTRENQIREQLSKIDDERLIKSLKAQIRKEKFNQTQVWGNKLMVTWKNILHLDNLRIFPFALEKFPCSNEQKEIKEEGRVILKAQEYLEGNFSEKWYKRLARYCENDVIIQKQARDELNKQIIKGIEGISSKKTPEQNSIYKKGTIASLAMYFIRKIVPEFNHHFPNFSKDKFADRRDFCQKAFRGGIVDSWNEQSLTKKFSIAVFDIVSNYPAIMKEMPLPVGIGKWVNVIRQEELDTLQDTAIYQAEIKKLVLNKKLSKIPLLYFSSEKVGIRKAYERVEKKVEWFTGAEWKFINKYYKGDWIIVRGLEFEGKKGIFDEYINHFFAIKNDPKRSEFETKFAKLMLDSLWGRFGLRTKVRNYELKYKGKAPKEGEPKFLHPQSKNYYQFEYGKEEQVKSFSYVPLSVMISSYARIKLMEMVIANQERVLYWDTDCVILKWDEEIIIIPVNQKVGVGLGEWKFKKEDRGWDCIVAKIYRIHELVVAKGYRKGNHKEINQYIDNDAIRDKTCYIADTIWKSNEYGTIIRNTNKLFPKPEDNQKRHLKGGKWESVKGIPRFDVKRFVWEST
jgi:hypothetical protein